MKNLIPLFRMPKSFFVNFIFWFVLITSIIINLMLFDYLNTRVDEIVNYLESTQNEGSEYLIRNEQFQDSVNTKFNKFDKKIRTLEEQVRELNAKKTH